MNILRLCPSFVDKTGLYSGFIKSKLIKPLKHNPHFNANQEIGEGLQIHW